MAKSKKILLVKLIASRVRLKLKLADMALRADLQMRMHHASLESQWALRKALECELQLERKKRRRVERIVWSLMGQMPRDKNEVNARSLARLD